MKETVAIAPGLAHPALPPETSPADDAAHLGGLFLQEQPAPRRRELEAVLENCPIPRVYVSTFPDLKEFKRHAEDIAWETEVWVAEMPDHLIHFNGEKFLGPA